MENINMVALSGNLTRDAEVRETASGFEVVSFGIAFNDRRKNASTGEWEDAPNFIDCTAFGARFGSIAERLVKGTKAMVSGKLRWSQWEKDGQNRNKIEVIVENIDLAPKEAKAQAQTSMYDEEIPF